MRPSVIALLTVVSLCARVAHCDGDDNDDSDGFEDLQTEFYLPHSETEEVDFSIVRPGGYGCYQW